MSNDSQALAKAFGGGDNLPTAFSPKALMQSTAAIPKSSDKPYLIFKDGEWTFGVDAAEIEDGAIWAVNPHSFMFGLIEWLDSEPGGEILVPAGTAYSVNDLVLKHDPEDPDHRIAPQIAVNLFCTNGTDKGLQVHFKTSTRGGVDALNGLAMAIAKQGQQDNENIVALVKLSSSHYMHKKYKRKTYVPVIELIEFVGFDYMDSDKIEEEKPKKEKTTTAKKESAKPPTSSRRRRPK